MGIGARKERLIKGRGTLKDIIAIPGFWLDLDFESEPGTHKVGSLPPDLAACLNLLRASPYEPTLVVHSGHGLQVYWLFNEAWYFANDAERTRADKLCASWQSWFKTHAKKYGWHIDSTADLTRVFRIPDTYNCKTDNHILVSIIQNSGKRYEPSDFDDFLIPDQPTTQSTHSIAYDTHGKTEVNILTDKNVSDRIKYLIIHGDTLSRYPSRSEAVFAVISSLVKAGYDDLQISEILLNPDYAISELPMEKGSKWVLQELSRARKKSTAYADTSNATEEFSLQLSDKGHAKETFYNLSMILQHDPEWKSRLRFDSFLNTSMIDGLPVDDIAEMRIAESVGKKYGFGGNNPKVLTRAIHAASSTDTYDSLQEWIYSLPEWDGTSRIRNWMVECCGAPETPLTGWISYVTIMQMIARAKTPGCMARLVPVWEGPENKGKTSAIMMLGDPWSMTFDMSMDSKEAHMAIQGCWVAELSELDTLRKTTETRLKSFISQIKDSYVPKYANYRVDHPRRTVFFGTTNEDNYLPGQTGNTRWLPVRTEWFDLDKLSACREQLFAEATSIFKETPDVEWWQQPSIIEADLAAERDDRRMPNVYEDELRDWLNGESIPRKRKYDYDGRPISDPPQIKYEYVTWPDIAEYYLQLDSREKWGNKMLQSQISAAIQALGWRRGKTKRDGKKTKCWRRPPEDNKE
jgi:hypothetical protein